VISIAMVFALVLMLNYLGARHYMRFMWSRQPGAQLSPQSVSLLKFVTNEVKVIVYYDKGDKLYDMVSALLDEYRLANPKISVEKVDYLTDATKAELVKNTYKLGGVEDKNLVIFAGNGRYKVVSEALLGDYATSNTGTKSDKGEPIYEKSLTAFAGEKWFSAALLSVISAKTMLACFLEGHGEQSIQNTGQDGYAKFAGVLVENNIEPMVIKLHGTNMIPADCNLLIIPGPRSALPADELAKINEYLNQGGRAFILFNYNTVFPKPINTGLEKILADWNVRVGMNLISDPENASGSALIASRFNPNHSLGTQMQGLSLDMAAPRSIEVLNLGNTGPEIPKVEPLVFSGKNGVTKDNSKPGYVPMMVAVEKGAVKGVLHQRGTTAILVAGDSMFLENDLIDAYANRDFAGFAANWLLDQTQLLQGVGSHPITEYKLTMTTAQLASIRLIFLVVVPGSILAFGGLVWFRRRH
jgi:hypothetical protein